MKLEMPEKNFIMGIPFKAELCNIKKQVPHYHPRSLELIYCLKGTVHLVAVEQEYDLHEGGLTTVDCTDIHCLSSDVDNLVLIFHIDLEQLEKWDEIQYVFFACESHHCFPYQEEALKKVKDYILTLSYSYFLSFPEPKDNYLKSVNNLVDILMNYFNWYNYENADGKMNEELYQRFARILDYVMTNYKSKITVSYLAEKEHINRIYFSQFISKTVCSSFSSMVNLIRCFHAENLLLSTNMSIEDISYECGFSDSKYFYKAFRTFWQETPTEHRKKYLKYNEIALKEQDQNKFIEGDEAASIIHDHIVKWHLAKTL